MKIAVTGCSWSCRDLDLPDIEFGQLVSDYYNSEYVNIAKPACSNAGIAMQIDYICNGGIGEKPDLVIINATTVTRSELKLLNDKRFDPSKSWDNVAYNMLFSEKFRDEHAPGYNKGYDPTIVVDSFATIFGEDLTKKLGEGHFHDRYVDAFTPNGDGVNDFWDFVDEKNVNGLDFYSNITISVFDRNGTKVYNCESKDCKWDGNSNGRALPPGPYFYTIYLNGGKRKYQGTVTILK